MKQPHKQASYTLRSRRQWQVQMDKWIGERTNTRAHTRLRLVDALVGVLAWAGLSAAVYAEPQPAPQLSTTEFQQCLKKRQSSQQFKRIKAENFWQYVPAQPDSSVITLLNHQPEFTKPVWDYMAVLVDAERVADGVAAYRQYAGVLRQIEQRYGVAAHDVVAVWGVESDFGKTLGKRPLMDSLATLSCFGRRQKYFRGELAAAMRIVQDGHVPQHKMTGSWAGAFGQTQFMPSTFLRLAQDFDGDGRKDIVDNPIDALASTAYFLKKAGYRTGQPWGYEVRLPANYAGVKGRKAKRAMGYWRSKGVRLVNGKSLPNTLKKAGLLLPAGAGGPAFLVGKNFDTFYSYNASEKYALAIAQLSRLIAAGEMQNIGFAAPWPTDDPGISRAQTIAMQKALLARGHDIGEADGKAGSRTRAAVKEEQRRMGMSVTGRAGQRFYRALMATAATAANPADGDRHMPAASAVSDNRP